MKELIHKLLKNDLTIEEYARLREWLQNPDNKKELNDCIKQEYDLNYLYQDSDLESAYQEVLNRIRTNSKGTPVRKMIPLVLKYAAVFIGLLVMGYLVYKTGFFRHESEYFLEEPQITLELEDGTIKILDETSVQIISSADSTNVINKNKDKLVYKQDTTTTGPLVYNILTVPYGKKFGITLSDGSEVYLNSGSSIRYPVKFIPNIPRKITLDGEAYLEIAHNSKVPFHVLTQEMNTVVMGTQFNVSSYSNEKNTFTVLVEGKVGVYKREAEEVDISNIPTIEPGERAVFDDDKIYTEKVNVKKYIAWTKGQLYFVNDSFDLILKELERHFNVEIRNNYKELNEKPITGTFETETLEEILKALQAFTHFEYNQKEKLITINPPK